MFKIPQASKEFVQDNSSDRKGNVGLTKNINFDDKGYLKLSDRTTIIGDSSTMTNLVNGICPVRVIEDANSRLFAVANKNVYNTSTIFSSAQDAITDWSQNTETNSPVMSQFDQSDMLKVNGQLLVTNGTDDVFEESFEDPWTVHNVSEVCELMCVFESENSLALSDDNVVRLVSIPDWSFDVTVELTLPEDYRVTCMAYNNQKLYIGTRATDGGTSRIFEWDGQVGSYNTSYIVPAMGVLSMDAYLNGIAFVDSEANLWYCSGGLQKLDMFPRHPNDKRQLTSSAFDGNGVFPRGLRVDGDNIYIAINPRKFSGTNNPPPQWSSRFPAGVWCFDPTNKLHLKYTLGESAQTATDAIATSSVNTTTDIITVAGATVPETGTPCFYYSSSTFITGLKDATRYFVINVSSTTLKLALTHSDAMSGTAIDLTGTGFASQYLTFNPNSDFGCTLWYYGGIYLPKEDNILRSMPSTVTNEILVGGAIQTGTSTTQSTTCISASQTGLENRGYWETPKMESSNILDKFTSLVKKFKQLETEEDKIIVKYRTRDNTLSNAVLVQVNNSENITWVDSTSFTSTSDLSLVAVGDEVELIAGVGAGYLAHITEITESSGTYTVTIDETVAGVSADDRAIAIFANWTKLGVIDVNSDDNDYGFGKFNIGVNAKWIQFKFELRGQGITVEELIVNNTPHLPVV